MADRVADEGVDHAVPARAERLVFEGREIFRRAHHARNGLRVRIDRESQGRPGAGLELADHVPGRAVADRDFRRRDTDFRCQRLHHPTTQIESISTSLLRRSHGAEVDRKMDLSARCGAQWGREDMTDAVVRLARADADAAGAGRMNVGERTLRLGQHRVRTRAEPGCRQRLVDACLSSKPRSIPPAKA